MCLHGNGNDHTVVLPFVEGLPLTDYRTVAPDLRGFGRTDKPRGTITFSEMAADVIELIRILELEEPVLLGYSMGVRIALKVAIEMGDAVAGLILVAGDMVVRSPKLDDLPASQPGTSGSAIQTRMFFSSLTPDLLRQFEVEVLPPTTAVPRYVYDEVGREFDLYDVRERAGKLRTPALIMVGSDDRICVPESSYEMNRILKRSVLHVIPSAGHLLQYEKRQECQRIISHWLSETLPRKGNSGTEP